MGAGRQNLGLSKARGLEVRRKWALQVILRERYSRIGRGLEYSNVCM